MIKINFENKKESIEKIFWDWFYKYNLKIFLKILSNDIELQKLIFESEEKYKVWIENLSLNRKNDYRVLKEFFFSSPKKHFDFKEKMNGIEISEESKSFFLKKYENFRKSQAPKIVKELEVHSCPYCNKNFIDIYYKCGTTIPSKFNGDIDHYFPKGKYEYLALCLYNLIPSCKVCNQEKGDRDKVHFHPYMDNHENLYQFKTNFNVESDKISIDYLYGLSENFDIEIFDYSNYQDTDSIKESIETFHLEDKYKNMTSFAKNIIRKAYIYNNGYLKDFLDQYSGLLDEEEIIKILFDYEGNDFLNKPLSKFKYDLMKEFDVIR
ncbi:HNH endonuclease [Clostridium cibarium]|uniref:HNH domain-containing protein n=1 Tax=Clostridium cibarium TaxID=2762247 RepID=A0ABR8PPF0_9CLOT|nr:hypothetical protein [Clostridium cibarium]MBD7910037.1 hypothetical protein [Clostridium cibarium]